MLFSYLYLPNFSVISMYYICNQEIKTVNVILKRKEGKGKERERDGGREKGREENRRMNGTHQPSLCCD